MVMQRIANPYVLKYGRVSSILTLSAKILCLCDRVWFRWLSAKQPTLVRIQSETPIDNTRKIVYDMVL